MSNGDLTGFVTIFEYEDGETLVRKDKLNRHNTRNDKGERPFFVIFTYLGEPENLTELTTEWAKQYALSDMPNVLSGGWHSSGRISIRPAWFYKLIHNIKILHPPTKP